MLKSIGAVAAGFIAWTVLFLGSNSIISIASPESFNADGSTDSTAILLLILVLSVVFSAVSGWLTSKIAQSKAFTAALALGILLLVVGIFVQSQFWDVMPLWYHLSFLVALLPATMAGYRLYASKT